MFDLSYVLGCVGYPRPAHRYGHALQPVLGTSGRCTDHQRHRPRRVLPGFLDGRLLGPGLLGQRRRPSSPLSASAMASRSGWAVGTVSPRRQTGVMSDKEHPARGQGETTALTAGAGESKGAVVITSNGMPEGYVPPSTSLAPSAQPASTTDTGGTGGSAGASIDGGDSE